jgi:hypothetical protein
VFFVQPFHTFVKMAALYSVTVQDINAHDFNRAYAAYLKR